MCQGRLAGKFCGSPETMENSTSPAWLVQNNSQFVLLLEKKKDELGGKKGEMSPKQVQRYILFKEENIIGLHGL